MSKRRLAGKVALVTGAGSGIGRAVAIALAEEGARLILAGRRPEELRETGIKIERLGSTFLAVETDITDEHSVEELLTRSMALTSKIDIAVNCAGIVQTGAIDEMDLNGFKQVMNTNTIGTWLCMKHEICTMKRLGSGVIVNIGSNLGYHSVRSGMGAYAASKAAVTVLTQTAALEAISHGVRINAISPGPVDTPLSFRAEETEADRDARMVATNPSKRVACLDEITSAVIWLCTDATYMVGQDIVIDGGASV